MSHVIHCATVSEQFVMIAAPCHMMRWHHGTRRNETCYHDNESHTESRYTKEWVMSYTAPQCHSSVCFRPPGGVTVHVEMRHVTYNAAIWQQCVLTADWQSSGTRRIEVKKEWVTVHTEMCHVASFDAVSEQCILTAVWWYHSTLKVEACRILMSHSTHGNEACKY